MLKGEALRDGRVDAVFLTAHEGLARELEQDALVSNVRQAYLAFFVPGPGRVT